MDTKIAPFFSLDLGYNLMIGSSDDYVFHGITNEMAYKRSGLFLSPTFGVDFDIQENYSMYVGISYLLNICPENTNSYKTNINSVGFRMGFQF